MAFVTPTTASGQVLTSSIWNSSVRDNLTYLYGYGANRARVEVTHNTTQSIGHAGGDRNRPHFRKGQLGKV